MGQKSLTLRHLMIHYSVSATVTDSDLVAESEIQNRRRTHLDTHSDRANVKERSRQRLRQTRT